MRFTEERWPERLQTRVHLQGALMEADAKFPKRSPEPGTSYIIDVAALTSINSIGIRAFMNWMQDLGDTPLTFTNCPKFFIDQVNMVVDFLPKQARIESFYVPYYSEKSETERMVLYREGLEFRNVDGKTVVIHPDNVIDPEGNAMEIDVINERFFKFLEKFA